MPTSSATSGEGVVVGLTSSQSRRPISSAKRRGPRKTLARTKDHFEQDQRYQKNRDRQEHGERYHRDAAEDARGDREAGMALEPI